MKHIYLIHAHDRLPYLNYLIDLLADEDFLVYVNIDKKSKIDLRQVNPKAILVRKRINIYWGEWSQVKATINSLAQIHKEQPAYGHIIFLSGQDFPIKTNKEIKAILEPSIQYIDYTDKCYSPGWPVYTRFERFHFYEFFSFLGTFKRTLLFRIFHRTLFYAFNYAYYAIHRTWRKLPFEMKAYAGSQWWALNQECVSSILDFYHAREKSIDAYFSYTLCPDEYFFHMLVLRSSFQEQNIKEPLRYIDWSTSIKGHPKILTADDYEKIISSDDILCRKIDPVQSKDLIDKLARKNNFPLYRPN